MQRIIGLLLLLFAGLSLAGQEDNPPSIGVPTFEAQVPVAEGSLILLGEAAERGLSANGGLLIVDRRRLDAVFLAREEVRHEDYLNSNREIVAAIGADYLLFGNILTRERIDRQYRSSADQPRRYVGIHYTMTFRLLEVTTGQILGFTNLSFGGGETIQVGEPQIGAPYEALLPGLEALAAEHLSEKIRPFVAHAFQGGMQVVDLLNAGKNRAHDILVASLQENRQGQELDVFIHEEYVIDGQTLQRPVNIGYVRVQKISFGLLECKVLDGQKDILEAFQAGQTLHCLPGEQKSHWAIRFMTLGLADKLLNAE